MKTMTQKQSKIYFSTLKLIEFKLYIENMVKLGS